MIKPHKLTCPNCEANLSVDAELKQCFCQYCGTKIIIDDGSTTHTYRKVDEARIKEAEAQQLVELKKLELEEQKRKDKNRLILIIICIVIIGPMVSPILSILFILLSSLFT